jgi:hypothetical protein
MPQTLFMLGAGAGVILATLVLTLLGARPEVESRE